MSKRLIDRKIDHHLNEMIINSLNLSEFLDGYLYLTNPEIGNHTSKSYLENRYLEGNVISTIRYYDPKAYEEMRKNVNIELLNEG